MIENLPLVELNLVYIQQEGLKMIQVNIHEAKTHLSKLIAEGREVAIARYGQPVARLIPIRSNSQPRKPGSLIR